MINFTVNIYVDKLYYSFHIFISILSKLEQIRSIFDFFVSNSEGMIEYTVGSKKKS